MLFASPLISLCIIPSRFGGTGATVHMAVLSDLPFGEFCSQRGEAQRRTIFASREVQTISAADTSLPSVM